MKKGLQDALIDMGATPQMLETKTFKMAEQAIDEGRVDGLATIDAAIEERKAELKEQKKRLDYQEQLAAHAVKAAESATRKLEVAVSNAKGLITDEAAMNGINTYSMVLERTMEAFGEDRMTEAVIIETIQAASYGMWRSIMGPKHEEGKYERPLVRVR